MSEDTVSSDQETESGKQPKKKIPLTILVIGAVLLIGSLGAAYYFMDAATGEIVGEAWDATADQLAKLAEDSERKERRLRRRAIRTVSGRYIPAYMDKEEQIVPLGDCSHTYIEISKDSIRKSSSGRVTQTEKFKTFDFGGPGSAYNQGSTYDMLARTEGEVKNNAHAVSKPSPSLPRWRHSEYQIAYYKEDGKRYLSIAQLDRFDLIGGGEKKVSSHGYYLRCPSTVKAKR